MLAVITLECKLVAGEQRGDTRQSHESAERRRVTIGIAENGTAAGSVVRAQLVLRV